VIRFSAFLVAVALGLLVAGVVTSKLTLVYVAIGVSGVALLALGVGALLKRNELFGQPKSAEPGPVRAEPAAAAYLPPAQPEPQVAPWEAAVPAASAWPAAAQPAPSRAGYLPSDQPLRPQPAQARPPAQAQPTAQARPPAQAQPTAQARPPVQLPPVHPPPVQPSPVQPSPVQAQPVNLRPADAAAATAPAAAVWGSGFPTPAERPADVPRRSAAFTPRPPTAPPTAPASRAPGVPAPGTWEWPTDAPVTPDELPAEDEQPAEDGIAAQDPRPEDQDPSAESQPSAEDQHATGDQRPAADQKTQQLPVVVGAASAAEPAPAPSATAPAPSATAPAPSATAPAPSATAPAPSATEPAPAIVDLQREVTVVPGVPRYHDPQCLLIRFMGENDLDKMTLSAAREAGCTPCRACLPD
jgi:hypothetical protein